MLAHNLRKEPRLLAEITQLIEAYPLSWRRWCSAPEQGGCACMGCVRHPAPNTVRGDPEGQPWPDERVAVTEEEVAIYLAAKAASI